MSSFASGHWDALSERRIQEAQAEGAFDNLPGFGQPIPGIDEPLEENWWIKEKLRREKISVLPPVLEVRLEAEKLRESLETIRDEYELRRRVAALNQRIRNAHYSPAPAMLKLTVEALDVDALVVEWRSRRAS